MTDRNRPNPYAVLLRVFPLVIAIVAIIVMKQKCGDSTAKMFGAMTDPASRPPTQAPPASPSDGGTKAY